MEDVRAVAGAGLHVNGDLPVLRHVLRLRRDDVDPGVAADLGLALDLLALLWQLGHSHHRLGAFGKRKNKENRKQVVSEFLFFLFLLLLSFLSYLM